MRTDSFFAARPVAYALPVALSFALWACGDETDGESAADGGGSPESSVSAGEMPTWHKDIAPLVAAKCAQCHKDGGIAPFSLEDYATAKPWSSAMVAATEAGRMPPFLAKDTDECTPRLPWKDDLRLSESELALLKAWSEAGSPEGDAATAAPITPPAPVELEEEDIVVTIPNPITVEGTADLHICAVVDPGVDADTYVTNRLLYAGNTEVLHHVVTYLLTPGEDDAGNPRTKAQLEEALMASKGIGIGGQYECFGGPSLEEGFSAQLLNAWAPGSLPDISPPNSGQPVPAGSLLLMDLHYHPTGAGAETDEDTHIALTTTDTPPLYIARPIFMGNFENDFDSSFGSGKLLQQADESAAEFLVPAGESAHIEQMEWTWGTVGSPLRVYGLGTHMHYVGRKMRIELENSGDGSADEPERECLIETPGWDFNWQRGYGYDADMAAFPVMNEGDKLHLTCEFDNTLANPFMAEALADQGLDAPVDVALGEDTLDEMCLGVLGIMYPNVAAFGN